jgi:general secretion pathway protein K
VRRRNPGAAPQRESGFALLIVLWAMVLLALILTQLLSAGRSEAQLAGNLRNAAVAEAVADGGVADAVFHLLGSGAQAWPARGTHALRIGRGAVEVTVESLSGKVNPNTAGLPLLRAMIGLCGRGAADAARLAQAIAAWRTPADEDDGNQAVGPVAYRAAGLPYAPLGLPFETDDELGLVLGMTPATLACLAPHMSLYQEGDPSLHTDDPFVARALAVVAQQGGLTSDAAQGVPQVVRITSVATVVGARFVRRATVRLTPGGDGGPFRILNWDSPAP